MQQERRRHPRLEIPLECALWPAGGAGAIEATMQDLSAGGAGLLTTLEIPVDTDIERLAFELPATADDEAVPIEVAGRVARCLQQSGVGAQAEFLVGIQFVEISRELFDQIQRFVFQRLRGKQKDRVQIERPIAIRFDRFDDFVDEVSVNLSATGMFIRTRDPRPPGSVFNFQFQLGDDFSLIEGRAEVVWRRRHPEGPDKPPGMGVKFLNLDVPSQRLIDRLIAQRTEEGEEGEPEPATEEPAAAAEPEDLEPAPAPSAPSPAPPAVDAAERPRPPDLERAEAAIVGLGEVNALRDAAAALEEELQTARRQHQQELQELRASLEDRQAAASSELEERLRDAEAAHRESERRRGELAGELEAARQEAADLQRRLDERPSTEELERLAGERDELRAGRDELQADLERLRGEADELRAQLAGRVPAEEAERLAAERDSFQATHDRLLAELDRANGVADELRRQLDDPAPAREIERLTGERDELEQAHRELQSAHDQLRTEIAESRERGERLSGERDELQQAHRELQSAHDRLRTEIAESRERGETLVAERDGLRTELDGLRTELEGVRAELDGVRAELDEAREELERRQSAHHEAVERLEAEHRAALEIVAAEVREETAARELAAAAEERDRLQEAAAQRQRELAAEAEAAAGEAAAELDGMRQELGEARQRGETLQTDLDSLRGELEARAAAEDEAAAVLAAAQRESERLRGDLAAAEEARRTAEGQAQQIRDEARQAARQAEERQVALRADVENAMLAAGGEAPPADRPSRGRRGLAAAALLLLGAALGALASGLFEPLGSLTSRLRSTPAAVATRPEGAAAAASEPAAPLASPQAGPAATPVGAEPPASGPPPVASQPQPEPQPGPESDEALAAVRRWAAAWSDQRVDDYLLGYADSFQPGDGQSRASWEASRRERIERPRSIQVGVEAARTVKLAADRVSVSFDQTYASDTYSDRVRKTLIMVWQEGAWKIAEERVIE